MPHSNQWDLKLCTDNDIVRIETSKHENAHKNAHSKSIRLPWHFNYTFRSFFSPHGTYTYARTVYCFEWNSIMSHTDTVCALCNLTYLCNSILNGARRKNCSSLQWCVMHHNNFNRFSSSLAIVFFSEKTKQSKVPSSRSSSQWNDTRIQLRSMCSAHTHTSLAWS